MATLSIPTTYETGFLELRRLSPEQLRKLASALTAIEPTVDYDELARRAKDAINVSDFDNINVYEIIRAVASLFGHVGGSGHSVDETVSAVSQAMQQLPAAGGRLSAEDASRFETGLRTLLKQDKLEKHFRTKILAQEGYRTFSDARIVTDVRPVFDSDHISPPSDAVIVHTLKIEFFQESRLRELHIMIDADDIEVLKKALNRATEKSKVLADFVRSK